LDIASIRYLAVASDSVPRFAHDPALSPVYQDDNVTIYEKAAALPRARSVGTAIVVHDPEEAFRRLTELARGGDASRPGVADEIVIEPSADGAPPPIAGGPRVGDVVRILPGSDPDRVDLEAVLVRPGWVVLADTFYPGWTATIAGAPARIHPADLVFRAVFVRGGRHRIVFCFAPHSFTLGVALAVLGGVVIASLLWRGRRLARLGRPRE